MARAKFKRLDRLHTILLEKAPNHPRNHFEKGSDEEDKDLKYLKLSIARDGIQDPIKVAKVDKKTYYIIDGVRRVMVMEQLGIDYINCVVYEGYSASEIANMSYCLNTIHLSKHFTNIEKAHHVKKMMDEFGYSYSDLERMGYGSMTSIIEKINLVETPSASKSEIPEIEFGLDFDRGIFCHQFGQAGEQALKNDAPFIHNWIWNSGGITDTKNSYFPIAEENSEMTFYSPDQPVNNFFEQTKL